MAEQPQDAPGGPQGLWKQPPSPPTLDQISVSIGRMEGSYGPLSKQVDQLGQDLSELRKEITRIDKQTFNVGVKVGVVASLTAAAITVLAGAATSLLIQWIADSRSAAGP